MKPFLHEKRKKGIRWALVLLRMTIYSHIYTMIEIYRQTSSKWWCIWVMKKRELTCCKTCTNSFIFLLSCDEIIASFSSFLCPSFTRSAITWNMKLICVCFTPCYAFKKNTVFSLFRNLTHSINSATFAT